jgi:rubrerythrin
MVLYAYRTTTRSEAGQEGAALGSDGKEDEKRCVICGLKVRKDATQCPNCGNVMTKKQDPDNTCH